MRDFRDADSLVSGSARRILLQKWTLLTLPKVSGRGEPCCVPMKTLGRTTRSSSPFTSPENLHMPRAFEVSRLKLVGSIIPSLRPHAPKGGLTICLYWVPRRTSSGAHAPHLLVNRPPTMTCATHQALGQVLFIRAIQLPTIGNQLSRAANQLVRTSTHPVAPNPQPCTSRYIICPGNSTLCCLPSASCGSCTTSFGIWRYVAAGQVWSIDVSPCP